MSVLLHVIALTAPLFLLVAIGYFLTVVGRWPTAIGDGLTRFVFSVAVPTLLFKVMSGFSKLPRPDVRLLLAYFGSCLLVFLLGRVIARAVFRMPGDAQAVFGVAGVFSNNVLLGLPLAKVTLGESAIPSVSLVLVFNALVLWTLVTVSVEWSRTGSASVKGIARTTRGVLTNPVVVGILAGTIFGFSSLPLPAMIDETLSMISVAAAPLSLIALGMGLAEYGIRRDLGGSVAICVVKLALQPLMVFLLARLLGLPGMETRVVVLMAALPVGANVYLMSREFNALGGAVASSLVLSTALSAVTTPAVLTLMGG